MSNEKLTVWQRLSKGFGPDSLLGQEAPVLKFDKNILLKTTNKDEYERELLQARQTSYIANQWSKIENNLYTQALYYEPTRLASYYDFEGMEQTPEISAALDTFAEESTTPDQYGVMMQIYSESKRIKSILTDLFNDKLDINTNLPMWTRNVCKYGDNFIFLKLDPEKGVVGCFQLPNIEIERVERGMINRAGGTTLVDDPNPKQMKFNWKNKQLEFNTWEIAHFRLLGDDRKLPYGTCLKYDTRIDTEFGVKEIKDIMIGDKVWSFDTKTQERVLSDVLDVVNSGTKINYGIYTKHNFVECSEEHKIMVFDGIDFIYKNTLELKIGDLLVINDQTNQSKYILEPIIKILETGEFETHDIYVSNENHNFYANGIVVHNSILEKARRIWRLLVLAEDAMLVYRTSRAPERRVFKVFVGNMDDKDVEAYVNRFANKFKRDQISDQKTGNVDLRYNQMAVDQDYFVPVRDMAAPMPIDTLPGATNLNEIADIEYIQKKLLTALRIPKAFLGFEEVVADGKNLALQDIRFARTINRVQKSMLAELNKIAIIHLFLLGFEDELSNFTLGLTNPSTQADLLKVDVWKEKVLLYRDAVTQIDGISPTSHSWAKKHVLGFSDEEIKLDIQQQRIERAVAKELENTSNIIVKTGIFDSIDSIYGQKGGGTTAQVQQAEPNSDMELPNMGSSGGGGGDMDIPDMSSPEGGTPAEAAPEAPPVEGGEEPPPETVPETVEDKMNILLEGGMLNEDEEIDLGKARIQLNAMQKELNKLIGS